MIIADNRSDRDRHREHFATYQTEGTPGVYMHTTLDHLLDTVHFAPSHQSRMLQAADVLAFIYGRRKNVKESDERSEAVMRELRNKIVHSGKLYGVGSWPEARQPHSLTRLKAHIDYWYPVGYPR